MARSAPKHEAGDDTDGPGGLGVRPLARDLSAQPPRHCPAASRAVLATMMATPVMLGWVVAARL